MIRVVLEVLGCRFVEGFVHCRVSLYQIELSKSEIEAKPVSLDSIKHSLNKRFDLDVWEVGFNLSIGKLSLLEATEVVTSDEGVFGVKLGGHLESLPFSLSKNLNRDLPVVNRLLGLVQTLDSEEEIRPDLIPESLDEVDRNLTTGGADPVSVIVDHLSLSWCLFGSCLPLSDAR